MGSFSQLSSGELPNPNDSEDWRSFWLKWDSEQLVGAIKERLQNEPDKEKDVPFFKSLLQGSRLVHLEEPYHLATTELFHTLLLQETEHRTQETYFREISDILLTELRYMIPRTLLALARDFLEQLQRFVPLNTAALEVVPPLIQTLAGLDILSTGDDSEWADCVTGTDAKDHMLDRICKLSWYPGLTLPLVSAFKDITFTTAQSDFFLSKVFNDATPRPIQTLSSEKLCRTESIVLLHISFAVKQDQELGQEVLKLTKITETPRLGPFLLSVLLAIAKIHRFETAVLDLVKGKICTFYRNSQKSQLVLSGRGNGRTPVADNTLTDTFHRLACNANVGWDQTIPSLIQLALVLLDVASGGSQGTSSFFAKPKERPIRSTIIQAVIDSQQRLVDKETSSDNVGQDPIGQLGISTLQLIFQHHRMVRTDVLDQVIARIEFRAESSPSCIELLGRLVAEFPETLATEYLTKIKELFNGLVYLPPDVAEQVMLVVLPLTHYDQGFCDHLMLVLRKHMFSRDLEGRQVALVGLLVFLTTLTCPHLQGNSSVMGSNPLPLQYEILGLLQRCLTQQGPIRLKLYEGLVTLMEQVPLSVAVLRKIFQLLYVQFKKYLILPATTIPPLRVEQAVAVENSAGGARRSGTAEPLAWLLKTLVHAHRQLIQHPHQSQTPDPGSLEFTTTLGKITTALLQCDLADFGLDEAADYNPTTNVGTKNSAQLQLITGIYEALLENELLIDGRSDTSVRTVQSLHRKYSALFGLMREKCGSGSTAGSGGTKKGKRPAAAKVSPLPLSLTSLSTVVHVLRQCYPSPTPASSGAAVTPKAPYADDLTLVARLLSIGHAHLKGLMDQLGGPVANALDHQHLLDFAVILVQAFLLPWVHIGSRLADDISLSLRQSAGGIVYTVADSWALCLAYLVRYHTTDLPTFLDRLMACPRFKGASPSPDRSAGRGGPRAVGYARHAGWPDLVHLLQEVIVAMVSENTPAYTEIRPLLNCLDVLTSPIGSQRHPAPISPTHPAFPRLFEWLRQFCIQVPIEELTLVRTLFRLLLNWDTELGDKAGIVLKIATDLHTLLGDTVQDEEGGHIPPTAPALQFALVTNRTAPAIALFVVNRIENYLDDTEWLIHQLRDLVTLTKARAQVQDGSEDDTEVHEQQAKKLEPLLYRKLCLAIQTLVVLEQTCLPSTVPVPLLHALQRTYKVLGQLIKLQLLDGGTVTQDLVRTVQLVGDELSKQLYIFIPQFQAKDSEEVIQTAQRSKKRKVGGTGSGTNNGAAANKLKTKITKESRLIPNLVYMLEQFEQLVIKLSTKSKVNLTQYLRRSTAHDFQIVQQHLADIDSEPELEEGIEEVRDRAEGEEDDDDEGEGIMDEDGGETTERRSAAPKNGRRNRKAIKPDDDDEIARIKREHAGKSSNSRPKNGVATEFEDAEAEDDDDDDEN
ncbi:hypothetical protein H4R33_003415 [Dimargaris cristalligena]|nr:hypothetical protein H4R33_003415 [Dimargaris cristalligena]